MTWLQDLEDLSCLSLPRFISKPAYAGDVLVNRFDQTIDIDLRYLYLQFASSYKIRLQLVPILNISKKGKCPTSLV